MTSFMVVQLMYRPLQGFQQSVPNLVVGVQAYRLYHYTLCGVGIVHAKCKCNTVDVQAATGFQQSVPNLVVGVQTCRLEHYTLCIAGNVQDKFHGCTVDVQAAMVFLTIST